MFRQMAKDIPALARPLVVLLVVVILGIMMIRYSNRTVGEAVQRRDTQLKLLNDARSRVFKSGQERDQVQKFLPVYYQLEKEGVVGGERRLDWIDALRVANAHADLYGVQYEISAQQPYVRKDLLGATNLDVRHSLMKLRFGLLHEEDLIRFLSALAAQGLGTFVVNQCSLVRQRSEERVQNPSTLQADCELSWITMQIPPSKKEPT